MNMQRRLLIVTALVSGGLLAGCAGDAPAGTTAPPAASSATQAPTDAGSTAAAPGVLPSPIVEIEYDIDRTPGDDTDDADRTTTDPQHLADLTALLEGHGIVSDYESDRNDCADRWDIEVDAKLQDGDTIDIEVETCDPTPFEQELIDLVQTWP